jgi:hypothetical protein
MTDNIIATERKTNDRQYNILFSLFFYYIVCHFFFSLWLLYCLSFVFLSVSFILSVICFSFCGYYIVCHLFFFPWLLYCLSFVFLSVAVILFVICFSFCGYYIVCHLFFFLWLLYCLLIATERKTNDRQYNSHRKKNKWQII